MRGRNTAFTVEVALLYAVDDDATIEDTNYNLTCSV
jgi:hypothetical protein